MAFSLAAIVGFVTVALFVLPLGTAEAVVSPEPKTENVRAVVEDNVNLLFPKRIAKNASADVTKPGDTRARLWPEAERGVRPLGRHSTAKTSTSSWATSSPATSSPTTSSSTMVASTTARPSINETSSEMPTTEPEPSFVENVSETEAGFTMPERPSVDAVPEAVRISFGRGDVSSARNAKSQVVCVMGSDAEFQPSFPPDSLCDVLIFSEVQFMGNFTFAPSQTSSSYALFLRHAVSAVHTRYMLALKSNSLASHVPLGLALSVLHIQHGVRGFGFLDVGLSKPGHTLTQYTSLLRIEGLFNMITSIKPADTEVFMGLVAGSSIASSVTAMKILKTLMSTVRANIVILETHAFKDADCIGNPYISWTGPGTSPFGDPSAVARALLKGGVTLANPDAVLALSLWLPVVRLTPEWVTEIVAENETEKQICYHQAFGRYDNKVCKSDSAMHVESGLRLGKVPGTWTVFAFDDDVTMRRKVKDAKMVLEGRYKLGWALFGIEYTQQDAEACGPPYPRIRAVKDALSGT